MSRAGVFDMAASSMAPFKSLMRLSPHSVVYFMAILGRYHEAMAEAGVELKVKAANTATPDGRSVSALSFQFREGDGKVSEVEFRGTVWRMPTSPDTRQVLEATSQAKCLEDATQYVSKALAALAEKAKAKTESEEKSETPSETSSNALGERTESVIGGNAEPQGPSAASGRRKSRKPRRRASGGKTKENQEDSENSKAKEQT